MHTLLVPPAELWSDRVAPEHRVDRIGQRAPTITCYNTNPGKTLTSPVTVGDTFVCAVNYPPGQTPSFVVVTAANGSPPPGGLPNTGVGPGLQITFGLGVLLLLLGAAVLFRSRRNA